MISRRLLRVKLLQVLYAQHTKEEFSVQQAEKELTFSINKAFDLYHLLMLIPIELVKAEAHRIETARAKLRPTSDDLNPNTRFVNNKLVQKIADNKQLNQYVSAQKLSWANYSELFKPLLNLIRERNYFIKYMNNGVNNFADDKNLILKILEEEIVTNSDITSMLEEQSIFWNDDLEFVLSMVIKTLASFKETNLNDRLMPLYKSPDDEEFGKKLLRRTILNRNDFDVLIKKHAQNWEFDRIALMDIIIMHMALAEITDFESIPVKVSLNEYIDIAKEYSTFNSNTFINGILDNVVKDLKAQGKILKTGRGLIEN